MDKKLTARINEAGNENAELICAKIQKDAQDEIDAILKQARSEAEALISQANRVIESHKFSIEAEMRKTVQKSREKVMSSLNLEKKRLILGEKDKFVRQVLEEVKKLAQDLRKDAAYPEFLEKSIIEGVEVIEEPDIEIYYSYLDEHLFDEVLLKKIKTACSRAVNKDCRFKLNKSDFQDLGVIVNSSGGRMSYDNRFLTRLEREKEKIYMELLKGSF